MKTSMKSHRLSLEQFACELKDSSKVREAALQLYFTIICKQTNYVF